MKKIQLYSILLTLFAMASCSPYKHVQNLSTMNDLDYGMEVKRIDLPNDIQLAYVEKGTGKQTILFVHGLGSYIPAWKKNIDELSKKYHCIAIDLPGYGKSSKHPHSGKMTFYASVINDFIEKKNLGKVHLAGHSMGGQISMVTALSYPEKIDRLILVDPAGFESFHAGQKQWFKDVMTSNLVRLTSLESIEVNIATNFYSMQPDVHFMIEDRIAMRTADDFENYCLTVSRSVAGMVDEPVLDKLSNINNKTLIFFGENDNLIPNRYLNPGKTEPIAKSGAGKIKNSELVMVPKCGHFMMFEKAEVFNQKVQEFLN